MNTKQHPAATIQHLASYGSLNGHFSIPSAQRPLNNTRVQEIRQYFVACSYKKIEPVIGVISIVDVVPLKQSYCVDGQHRLEALRQEYRKEPSLEIPFYIMKYQVQTLQQVDDYFQLINKNVPLADYMKVDVEDDKASLVDFFSKSNANKKENASLVATAPFFDCKALFRSIEIYITGLSLFHSTSLRRPYVNVTHFMNELLKSPFVGEYGPIKTLANFVEWFENVNDKLKQLSNDASYLKKMSIVKSQKFLQECIKHNNYLCLDKSFSWMTNKKWIVSATSSKPKKA